MRGRDLLVGRSITLLSDVMKKQLMGETDVIVFGRFLLDSEPIKLNKFNGIVGNMLVVTGRSDGRARAIDGRVERKGKGRKRLLHYRDQLLGAVSYGICCTKCHVAYCAGTVFGGRERLLTTQKEREGKVEGKGS